MGRVRLLSGESEVPIGWNPSKKPPRVRRDDYGILVPICPHDRFELLPRHGRYGEFFGCANYPTCQYTAPIWEVEKAIRKHKEATA